MHSSDPQAINAATRPEDGFDTRDLTIPHLWKHIVGFFAYTVAMILFVAWLYDYILPKVYPDGGLSRARTDAPIVPKAPYPLIQSGQTAIMDIVELKQKERQQSTTVGIVDEKKGIYSIPLDRAAELVSEEGLNPKTIQEVPTNRAN